MALAQIKARLARLQARVDEAERLIRRREVLKEVDISNDAIQERRERQLSREKTRRE